MPLITPINLTSLSSLNALNRNQLSLSQSVEKLSTGLSINSPRDNPANFSISEKMRSYISGLKQATMNAQNGMSYLQSAESATTEITNMLQRMRELAVEGANEIYTNNDRNEIQKEMDQLREEIGRVSATTEFNSTKILTGATAGSWLSNSANIAAVLTGNINDANYNVSLNVTPGQNQVSKSQIFSLANGELGAEIRRTAANTTNVVKVSNPNNIPLTSADYTLTVSNPQNAVAGDIGSVNGSYFQTGSNYAVDQANMQVDASESGYMVVEFTGNDTTAANPGTTFRAKFVSSITGKEGAWVDFTTNVQGSLSASYTSDGFNINFSIPVTTNSAGATVNSGDKLLFSISDMKGLTNANNVTTDGGGVISVNDGSNNSPFIVFSAANSVTKANNNDGVTDINEIPVTIVSLGNNGTINIGGMTFGFNEGTVVGANGRTLTGAVTIDLRGAGEAATTTTKLSQIKNFTDSDGNKFINSTQELIIRANSSATAIYLEAGDTIESFTKKINDAMMLKLNMNSGDVAVNKQAVSFVPEALTTGFKTVPGTIVLQSTMTGESGDISFIGDERLLKALGFATIQESTNNISKLTVTNSHTGESMGEVTVTSNRANNIINGVEIALDSRAGVKANWNSATQKIDFVANTNYDSLFTNLHMVDNRTRLQIGTRQGENLDITIPEVSLKSLQLEQLSITTATDAQKAISTIDSATKKVVGIRATIGAQINRLQNATTNLSAATQNMIQAESTIRDLDVAAESSNYAMQQLMTQTSTAMLAQANQIPKLVLDLLRS